MITQLTWESVDAPDPTDMAVVDSGLDEYNHRAADLAAIYKLACFARLPSGEIAGGAVGRYWGTACELQQIWVRQDYRNSGVGKRLMELFERRAQEHGCTLLYLDTFSFQAPNFYLKLGYEVACEFPGFPGGVSKFIMQKKLQKEWLSEEGRSEA